MLETLVQTELNVSDFYCISVRQYNVSYQGHYKSEIVKDLVEKEFTHRINSAGYIELTKGAIEVTLT